MPANANSFNQGQDWSEEQQIRLLEALLSPIEHNSTPSKHREIQYLIFQYRNRVAVILKQEDWRELIQLLERIEAFHQAMGIGFNSTLQQVIAAARDFKFRNQQVTLVNLEPWQRLTQEMSGYLNEENWQILDRSKLTISN